MNDAHLFSFASINVNTSYVSSKLGYAHRKVAAAIIVEITDDKVVVPCCPVFAYRRSHAQWLTHAFVCDRPKATQCDLNEWFSGERTLLFAHSAPPYQTTKSSRGG